MPNFLVPYPKRGTLLRFMVPMVRVPLFLLDPSRSWSCKLTRSNAQPIDGASNRRIVVEQLRFEAGRKLQPVRMKELEFLRVPYEKRPYGWTASNGCLDCPPRLLLPGLPMVSELGYRAGRLF